jgi:hypothetical protein
MLMSFSFHVQQFSIEERVQNEVERETTLFLDYFCRDVMSSVGVVLDYPGLSPYAQTLVLKIPQFDSLGLQVPESFNYIVYEYVQGSDSMTRWVYGDADGTALVGGISIPFSSAYWESYGDGHPVDLMVNADSIRNLQASIMRYESINNRVYSRSFVAASTPRNTH